MNTSEEFAASNKACAFTEAACQGENTSPMVSVIVMNYNYANFLSIAIKSCLMQTYDNVEIIVVDDGSTDSSTEIISGFDDKVSPVFKQNGGQASALNSGFAACKGEIICLLDADDLFLPERLDYVVELFCSEPDIGWVFTESVPIDTSQIQMDTLCGFFDEIREMPVNEQVEKIDFRSSIKLGKIPDFTPSTSNLCLSRKIAEAMFPLPEIKGLSGVAISDLYIKTIAVGLSAGYVSTRNMGVYRLHNNYYKNLDLDKKRRMFGEINTATGYWMSQKFPEFVKISRKFLSKGFSTYLSSHHAKQESSDADCNQMLKDYLNRSSPLEKLKVYLLIVYYHSKLRFKNFV